MLANSIPLHFLPPTFKCTVSWQSHYQVTIENTEPRKGWGPLNPELLIPNPVHFPLYQAASCQGSPAGRGWDIKVVVMAKTSVTSDGMLCPLASCTGLANGNDFHSDICFVFQSWGSEIHVSHSDEVGQSLQTSLFLWPISLTCLVCWGRPFPRFPGCSLSVMSSCIPRVSSLLNAVF